MNIQNLYEEIRKRVVEYIETEYRTSNSAFNSIRQELIKSDNNNVIFREPTYEPIPRYDTSNLVIEDILSNLNLSINNSDEQALLIDLLKKFDPIKYGTLYKHQTKSLEFALKSHKNFVVTTGTGSGKSFCFQIPLLMNLLFESLGLINNVKWDGNSLTGTTWWKANSNKFETKRKDNKRIPAVRALIMYPLNALVQDQIDGLRGILNSSEAENYYNTALNGDRIYFGQYSGTSPGRGKRKADNLTDCKKIFNEIDSTYSQQLGQKDVKLQSLDGSELISRWDMQESSRRINH